MHVDAFANYVSESIFTHSAFLHGEGRRKQNGRNSLFFRVTQRFKRATNLRVNYKSYEDTTNQPANQRPLYSIYGY